MIVKHVLSCIKADLMADKKLITQYTFSDGQILFKLHFNQAERINTCQIFFNIIDAHKDLATSCLWAQ